MILKLDTALHHLPAKFTKLIISYTTQCILGIFSPLLWNRMVLSLCIVRTRLAKNFQSQNPFQIQAQSFSNIVLSFSKHKIPSERLRSHRAGSGSSGVAVLLVGFMQQKLGLVYVNGMLVHRRLPQHFVWFSYMCSTNLYSWVEGGNVGVKCQGGIQIVVYQSRKREENAKGKKGIRKTRNMQDFFLMR